jgi:acetyltransferase-like isoleucine patch superfamily enzyme
MSALEDSEENTIRTYKNISYGRFTYFGGRKPIVIHRGGGYVNIGSFCSIADGVTFFGNSSHCLDYVSTYPFQKRLDLPLPRRISGRGLPSIGNDVWIGTGASILGGVHVGTGSVIAAYSVVTKDVPPYAVVAGNPAVVKKYRFPSEIRESMVSSKWWDLHVSDIRLLAPHMNNPVEFLGMVRELL